MPATTAHLDPPGETAASREPMRIARQTLYYGICGAINRGAPLLCLPLLVSVLSLADYGVYALVQIAAPLLGSLLCLNGSVGILREGSESPQYGFRMFCAFLGLTAAMAVPAAAAGMLLSTRIWPYCIFAVMLSFCEAIHFLVLAWLNACLHYRAYLAFVSAKAGGFLLVLLAARTVPVTLPALLTAQFAWYGTLAIIAVIAIFITRPSPAVTPGGRGLRPVLGYTLPTLPHSAAQWIMSGSDKFIVGYLRGPEAAGFYSLCYSVASAWQLVNSGIAAGLPAQFFRRYTLWQDPAMVRRILLGYSGFAILAAAAMRVLLDVDRNATHLLKYDSARMLAPAATVLAGLYLLGIYLVFTNYLSYHRRTGVLALQTAFCAGINLVLTLVLVWWAGSLGAAAATFLTYAIYAWLVFRTARRSERSLCGLGARDVMFVLAASASIVAIGCVGRA